MIGWIAWICIALTLIVAVALTIVVMLQSSKDGASAALGNTFYGANKGKTLDGVLSKLTIYLGIAFVVLCFATTITITK